MSCLFNKLLKEDINNDEYIKNVSIAYKNQKIWVLNVINIMVLADKRNLSEIILPLYEIIDQDILVAYDNQRIRIFDIIDIMIIANKRNLNKILLHLSKIIDKNVILFLIYMKSVEYIDFLIYKNKANLINCISPDTYIDILKFACINYNYILFRCVIKKIKNNEKQYEFTSLMKILLKYLSFSRDLDIHYRNSIIKMLCKFIKLNIDKVFIEKIFEYLCEKEILQDCLDIFIEQIFEYLCEKEILQDCLNIIGKKYINKTTNYYGIEHHDKPTYRFGYLENIIEKLEFLYDKVSNNSVKIKIVTYYEKYVANYIEQRGRLTTDHMLFCEKIINDKLKISDEFKLFLLKKFDCNCNTNDIAKISRFIICLFNKNGSPKFLHLDSIKWLFNNCDRSILLYVRNEIDRDDIIYIRSLIYGHEENMYFISPIYLSKHCDDFKCIYNIFLFNLYKNDKFTKERSLIHIFNNVFVGNSSDTPVVTYIKYCYNEIKKYEHNKQIFDDYNILKNLMTSGFCCDNNKQNIVCSCHKWNLWNSTNHKFICGEIRFIIDAFLLSIYFKYKKRIPKPILKIIINMIIFKQC